MHAFEVLIEALLIGRAEPVSQRCSVVHHHIENASPSSDVGIVARRALIVRQLKTGSEESLEKGLR